jgi:hypothetical protein
LDEGVAVVAGVTQEFVLGIEDIPVCCEGDWGGFMASIVDFLVVNFAEV